MMRNIIIKIKLFKEKLKARILQKFTLRKFICFFITVALTLLVKKYLFWGLDHITSFHLIIASFISMILNTLFNTIFEIIEIESFDGDFKHKKKFSFPENGIVFQDRDKGEGSSKTPYKGKNSPINYEDYEWSSDSDSGPLLPKQNTSPLKLKSSKEVLKDFLDQATNEEIGDRIDRYEQELEEYKISGGKIPAAKSQILKLEEKIDMCAVKITENFDTLDPSENLKDEDKGKQPEYKDKGKEPEYKGKGKEPEYKGR